MHRRLPVRSAGSDRGRRCWRWAAFFYIGLRADRRRWLVYAVLYFGLQMRRWRWLAYAALYLGLAIGVYLLFTTPVYEIGGLAGE